MSDKVKVAVRVRPTNRREIELGTKCCVDMENNQTILHNPSKHSNHEGGRKQAKTFAFDHCFWSMEESNPKFASQERVFEDLGRDILERAFEGYNGCIFAYGQTGSGKSYTMMGSREQKGIIPRLCDALFEGIDKTEKSDLGYKVEVSYMEIYNEKVHNLLDPKGSKQNLRVREHNILGPYVDGLSTLLVTSFEDIDNLMSEGNKSRTVAATNMNSESSRSHAVFNIIVTQTLTDLESMVSGEKVSKLSLVDLAGSERAQKTGAVGERLKEGSNINKSLTTLGLVISALADQSGKKKDKFVPYRDSVLTWLLKDNLGGNSKTVMVATISPSADNYEETLSTLRYADRAKRIVNHAVINEDPNARIIRELREEVDLLRQQLSEAQSMKSTDLTERLEESEKLMKEMSKTWEEKLQETEKIHHERHAALEKMGISVQTSGIKVEQGNYYLVNLNADPSLNELLVYYLKDHTLIGRPNAPVEQDIQLSGLGIMPEHCVVDLENNDVYITPIEAARTCVNGSVIGEKTRVKHGDRILWGTNHFFRINCPKANSPQTSEPDLEQTIDYDFAQAELMMKELGNDPINEALQAIEKQHEEEKQEALEKQRRMYERQMQMLRNQLMSPSTPSIPFPPFDLTRTTPTGSGQNMHPKYQQWAQERDKLFKQSLAKLREEVVKANALVREANFLADEMGKVTEFSVTLQIPASNLSPNRRRGAFVSEPAILVKRKGKANQIWSMEKFENKIIDMREMYEERKENGLPLRVESDDDDDCGVVDWDQGPPIKGDPFYESQENHNLIGVANVFLDCLFHDVKLDYQVPIISQQGEIAGKLHVEVSKLGGGFMDRYADTNDDEEDDSYSTMGAPVFVRVAIREAKGLPPALSNFVFCHYSFWGHPEPIVVPPDVNPETYLRNKENNLTFRFNHRRDFKVHLTEEFVEHCSEGALSIEVWGHRSQGFGVNGPNWQLENVLSKSRSLVDRWNEVMRKIELWVEIHELNDQGEYAPVEVTPKMDIVTGGVFQLRQGHSRRILVKVKPVQNSGTLPLICESINSIAIGCITARQKMQKGLDSYQEEDLNSLRERWSEALMRRKQYLDEQIQKLMNKQDKSDTDLERERALIDQWVCLTEERNAVLVPAAGTCIPGAPADWSPALGMEEHIPVLFLDLNSEDMSTPNAKEGYQAAGINSILPKEHGAKFVNLPIIKNYEKDVDAVASWDSSMHDSVHLNRVTPSNERVYMILKATVRLSHPASMELVLRKRLCINIYKKQILSSMTDMLMKRMYKIDYLYTCGVSYEIVSNIPKASEDLEDMETLAQLAASQNEINAFDGETYIEKYIKGVSAVESILTLDKLRQEVAVKECLGAAGKSLRKTASVPNIHHMVLSPTKLDEQIRADSIQDLYHPDPLSPSSHFIASPKSALSPHASKLVKPMRTLLEEQHHRERKPLLHQDTEDSLDDDEELARKLPQSPGNSDEFQDFESYQSQQGKLHAQRPDSLQAASTSSITHSTTADSLAEIQAKSFTPSMTSSGYGSQAVSTLTLSSEDSTSIRSIGTDEALDKDGSAKSSPKVGSLESGHGESDEEQDPGPVEDRNEEALEPVEDRDEEALEEGSQVVKLDSEEEPEGRSEKDQREKRDSLSLMDDVIPELLDSPLEPILSPPAGSENMVPAFPIIPSDSGSSDTNLNDPDTERSTLPATETECSNSSSDTMEDGRDSQSKPEDSAELNQLNQSEAILVNQSNEINDSTLDQSGEISEHVLELRIEEENEEEVVSNTILEQENEAEAVGNIVLEPENNEVVVTENVQMSELEVSDRINNNSRMALERSDTVDSNSSQTEGEACGAERDSDPYSVTAMEELERLGESEHQSLSRTNSETKSESNNSVESGSGQMAASSVLDSAKAGGMSESGRGEPAKQHVLPVLDASLELGRPKTPEPPVNRRRGSSKRERPVSCILPSKADHIASLTAAAYEDLALRSGASPSEEHLSGGEDSVSLCSFGSRADLDRLHEVPVPSWIQVGECVTVTSSRGTYRLTGQVQYVGNTAFASGPWIGVELDHAEGKNNGTVNGIQYFKCRPRHGIFVRHDKLIWDKRRKGSRKSSAGTNRRSMGSLSGSTSSLSRSSTSLNSQPTSPGASSPSSFMKPTAASRSKKK